MVDWRLIAAKMKERTLTLNEQAKIAEELREEEAEVKEEVVEQGLLKKAVKAEAAGNIAEAEEALRQAQAFAFQETKLTTVRFNEIREEMKEEFLELEYETEHGEIKEEELSKLAEEISKDLDETIERMTKMNQLKIYYEQCARGVDMQIANNPALKQQLIAEAEKYTALAEEAADKEISLEKRCRYLGGELRNLEKRKKQFETEILKLQEELVVQANAIKGELKLLEEELRRHPNLLAKKTEAQAMAADQELSEAIKVAQKNPAQAAKVVEAVKENAEKIAAETKGTPVAKVAQKVKTEAELAAEVLEKLSKQW